MSTEKGNANVTNEPGTQPAWTPPHSGPAEPELQPAAAPTQPVEQAPRTAPKKPAKPGGRASAGTLVLLVGLIVAIGGVAFAVGRVTAPASAASTPTRSGGFPGAGALGNGYPNGSFAPGALGDRAGGLGGLGGLSGTVTAVTADHITIQVGGANGRTIDVPVDGATAYHTEIAATASAVRVGSEVTVRTASGAGVTGTAPGGSAVRGSAVPGANPAPSGAPGGAGLPGGFSVGTATDVTVIPSAAP